MYTRHYPRSANIVLLVTLPQPTSYAYTPIWHHSSTYAHTLIQHTLRAFMYMCACKDTHNIWSKIISTHVLQRKKNSKT